ncbi:MAG: hypothetical protein J5890_04225 [Clostridia bacterium]|nr:hypothetical protein [Clostridia bacterium]
MLTMDRFPVISTKEQLKSLVSDIGFLPFFSCGIPGFCLRDTVDSSVWFVRDVEGPWEWKTDVGIYGKLFRGKAVFMSPEWYGILACYRRDGYDYEGMFEDGLLSRNALSVMESIGNESLISTVLRSRVQMESSAFDKAITELQMKCFLLPSGFEYAIDKNGRPYGWGIAKYAPSDYVYGKLIADAESEYTPDTAKEMLIEHVMEVCPGVDIKKAERLIRG